MRSIRFIVQLCFLFLLPVAVYAQDAGDKVTQTIAGINWLENEPDGYFSWQEANQWCEEQGARLPNMSELIAVWDASGGQISPNGFQKDTFYWAIEECTVGTDCHKGCAMDWDCSTGGAWLDDSNGHPKCVLGGNADTGSDDGECATLDSSDLTLTIPCAELGGTKYGFTLKYYTNPNDPFGHYWKLDINSLTAK